MEKSDLHKLLILKNIPKKIRRLLQLPNTWGLTDSLYSLMHE